MPAGRPTKYTPEIVKLVVQAIELGAPYRHACNYAGIDESTFERWRKQKTGFADAIKKAEGAAVLGRLATIRKFEPQQWQPAAWWLERRYYQEFGKTVQEKQITGKDGGPIVIAFGRDPKGPD